MLALQAGGRRFDPGHVHHFWPPRFPQIVHVGVPLPQVTFRLEAPAKMKFNSQ